MIRMCSVHTPSFRYWVSASPAFRRGEEVNTAVEGLHAHDNPEAIR